MGINDVGIHGGGQGPQGVTTPHIDGLGQAGVSFDRGYAGSAICTVSRAALMTGRYPWRFGLEFTPLPGAMGFVLGSLYPPQPPMLLDKGLARQAKDFNELGMPASELTLAEMLKQKGYHNIWHNLTKARAHVLRANYDAMFVVESDVIPPANALAKLLSIDADIAGGWYVMRHGAPVANAFVHVPAQDDPGTYMLDHEMQGIVQTNGVCMGCVLIHRRVIERIPFRMHDSAAPDWSWMTDCNSAGFVTVVDASIKCGHKRPDGVVLWPI
jgi:hypothetical protein